MGVTSEKPLLSSYKGLPPFPEGLPTAPLITLSLAKLLKGDPAECAALLKVSKGIGFFYLNMLGCEQGERLVADAEALFDVMAQFFQLPDEEKMICDRDTVPGTEGYYGYRRLGNVILDKSGKRDRHEGYNLKKDDLVGNTPPLPAAPLIKANLPLLEDYARRAHSIVILLLTHLDEQLGLPPNTLPRLHRLTEQSGDHVRFLHAPPPEKDGNFQSGAAHTDFGSLTILFNWLGGLQVVLPGAMKEWVYVRPVPGCAVVNLGDAMVKFSAGLLRSNIHRVVTPPGDQAELHRYSLVYVYFSRPEDKVILKRLKGGVIDEQPATDQPEQEYTAKEWILRRGLTNKATEKWKPEDWEKSRGTEAGRG